MFLYLETLRRLVKIQDILSVEITEETVEDTNVKTGKQVVVITYNDRNINMLRGTREECETWVHEIATQLPCHTYVQKETPPILTDEGKNKRSVTSAKKSDR